LKRNLKLILEYDGSMFHGWQYQVGLRTVQAVLEEAIARLTGEYLRVTAAGRTDAGVHALEQVVNFHTASSHAPEVFVRALNAILPRDVAVRSCEEPAPKFNARSWAQGKIYRYLIYNLPGRRAFGHQFCWHIPEPLDLEAMNEAAKFLIGEHNFKSFQAAGKDNEGKNPVREIKRIEIKKTDLGYVISEFEAKSFLRQMVRNMMGTLVMAGRGKIKPEDLKQILESQNRKNAGPCAPGPGLYLAKVFY
jgi:tRNA pseudouridine38-40 synthase